MEDRESAAASAGQQPVYAEEIVAPGADSQHMVITGHHSFAGAGAVPASRFEAFVPDVLQRDVPVPGGRRFEFEHQRLVGASRYVPIMYKLSGVVSAAPRSAASAVTSVFGRVSSSGLIVR